MMKSFASSIDRRSTLKSIAALAGLTIILCVLGYWVRTPLAHVLVPLFARSAGSSYALSGHVAQWLEERRTVDALAAENETLKREKEEMQTLLLDRNQLYEENTMLKEKFGRDAEPNRLLASVLVHPGALPYDTFVVDVGSSEGVSVGDKVSAGGTTLIGTVESVYEHTAHVSLYSSAGKEYDGFLRGTIPVRVVGQGGGSLKADVPYDAHAVEGDNITLPLLEANTAFLIEHVQTTEGNSSSVAYVRLPVSPFNLRFVEVWRQK